MRQVLKGKPGKMWCLFFLAFSLAISSNAQDLSKYHALFIGKFIDYIEWPDGKSNLTIGVVGDSKVFDELQSSLAQKGKAKVKKVTGVGDISDCQVVFIPARESKLFDSIKDATSGRGVLLITESEQFARKGASISFYLENGKLRFMLNESVTNEQNLRISSGLTSLATVL